MSKIMGKLKHTFNAFPDLQTKFFHKQCIIWTVLPSFNEFLQHSMMKTSTYLRQFNAKQISNIYNISDCSVPGYTDMSALHSISVEVSL